MSDPSTPAPRSKSAITASGVMLLLGVVLVLLKVIGISDLSWAATLVPFYAWGVLFVVKLVLGLGLMAWIMAIAQNAITK